MSISRAAREVVISLLADEQIGLNPTFTEVCGEYSCAVPMPGMSKGQTGPFLIPQLADKVRSSTFMRGSGSIDTLMADGLFQYPFLMVSARSALQDRRLMGAQFTGHVQIQIDCHLGWLQEQPPPGNDYETQMDALEESFMRVLNNTEIGWQERANLLGITSNVVYNGDLDIVERAPLTYLTNFKIYRRTLRLALTCRVIELRSPTPPATITTPRSEN